jgi:hypothetical protein
MLVFWKQALVFPTTPKTAWTAIEQAIGSLATISVTVPTAVKHTDAAQFNDRLKPYLRATTGLDFATTALVREPWDWLGSWYRNRQREDEARETSTQDVDFEEFVRRPCSDAPPEFTHIGRQTAFLTPRAIARVDNIFCYDRLDHFVHFVEDLLNFEIILPRLNVSHKSDLQLSSASEDLIRRNYSEDFVLYHALA